MLYNLLFPLADDISVFNLFRYITLRTGGAVVTALLVSFVLGPAVIRWLKSKQAEGQPIREDGPQSHLLTKKGTPTMGGVLILMAVCTATLLWTDLTNPYVWAVLAVTLGFGFIGFLDDFLKVSKRNSKGLAGKLKLAMQLAISGVAMFWILSHLPPNLQTTLAVPFFKDLLLDFGWMFAAFAVFVTVGSSNAVNLTDGLDGLAIVPVMIAAASFGVIAYLAGNKVFADYLQIHFVLGTGELAIICGAVIGAGLGFLWFNAPPAAIFMGDTGSLALGGMLGTIAVAAKHEIVLVIIGGLFVMEALSVIIQVASFKMTGKRVFKMAPIHHHFEQLGWTESQVVIRFWIISIMFALAGLATLKLR